MVLGQSFAGYRISQTSLEHRFERGLLGNGTGVYDVRDTMSFWKYVNQTLLPTVYAQENHDRIKSIIAAGDYEEPVYENSAIEVKLASGPTYTDDDNAGENPNIDYLLGPITFRTVRIRDSETCYLAGGVGEPDESMMPLIAKQITQAPTGKCYGTWHDASEEMDNYGSSVEPFKFWNGRDDMYWQGKEGEYWNGILSYDAQDLFGNPSSIGGELATYPSSGYVMKVDRNQTTTNITVGHMYNNKYVDVATRVITIEFVVWNGHNSDPRELVEGDFIFTRIMFEISATGQWVPSIRSTVVAPNFLSPLRISTFWQFMYLFCEFVLYLFLLYFIAEELSEACVGGWEYFEDGWNLLDWANLIILMAAGVVRFMMVLQGGSCAWPVITPVGGDPDSVQPNATWLSDCFASLAELVITWRYLHSFNVVLIWLKITKFAPFLPNIRLFKAVLSKSWQLFVSAIIFFMVVYIGFCFGFTVAFGDQFPVFQDFGGTFLFLSRAFMGDVSMGSVYKPGMAAILILMFTFAIILGVLSVFMGTFVYAVSIAKEKLLDEDDEEARPIQKVFEFVKRWCRDLYETGLERAAEYIDYFPGLKERLRREKRRTEKQDKKRNRHAEKRAKGDTYFFFTLSLKDSILSKSS